MGFKGFTNPGHTSTTATYTDKDAFSNASFQSNHNSTD